ncbi:sensor histidine kinase [Diaphorobacter caeni]|uniref:sensor histidine kinase n=1 Tax=Diaphorobacter caeni TaxID=2784387 RepID=UPI00188E2F28|nr:HAMP domain-containing sensor histidine kinase [Diaphorobacter caeni]MBF5003123.1 HAMP domain-containing histidine kinase [Diaphorobacter caeni]
MESLAAEPPPPPPLAMLGDRRARRRWALLLGIAVLFLALGVGVAWQWAVQVGQPDVLDAGRLLSLSRQHGVLQENWDRLILAVFAAFVVVLVIGGVLVWQLLRSLSHQREQLCVIAEQRDTLQDAVQQLHEAQRATETYRNFVSLVSHQFRTPLAVIDSTAQRLLRTARSAPDSGFADSELVLEKMHLTRSTVEHMNKLIDSVLTSVRLESGALRLQAQRLNMDELVGKVMAAHAHLLHDRPLLMETDGNGQDFVCMGDANLLEHVLQNLLSNACKYTEAGTAISVTLARAHNGHILCTMRDWGEGVSETELPLLFERFFRSETARSANGTGLGLYLARSIAQLHGGDLHASLPQGGGLAVHLRIPAGPR